MEGVTTAPDAWMYLIGVIIPFIAGLLMRSGFPAEIKFIIVIVVSAVVGGVTLWVRGELIPGEITPENLVLVLAQVFMASQATWHLLIKRLPGVRDWLDRTGIS